jgi:hypothetical protein
VRHRAFPYTPFMLSRPRGFIAPCLPTKAPHPPSGEEWLHEIKHDGFRVIARKVGSRVKLYCRPGNDLTYRFSADLRPRSCIWSPINTCVRGPICLKAVSKQRRNIDCNPNNKANETEQCSIIIDKVQNGCRSIGQWKQRL